MSRVRTIDFRRPSKFAREQVRRLEHAHEAFCRSAASRLSAELRTGIELRVKGSDQLPYVAAVHEMPQDALVVILELSPLETQAALVIEPWIAAQLVDRMLGAGDAARTEAPVAGLTDVEVAVLRRGLAGLVEPLSTTWMELADVRMELGDIEHSPISVQLVPPSEPTLMLAVELRIEELVSVAYLMLPYRSLEVVMPRIGTPKALREGSDDSSSAAVRAAVRQVEVELRAEVGAVELTLAEVRGLRPGDVVRLRRPASRGVVLRAGEVAAYVASPGRNANARAVQVRERCREVR